MDEYITYISYGPGDRGSEFRVSIAQANSPEEAVRFSEDLLAVKDHKRIKERRAVLVKEMPLIITN